MMSRTDYLIERDVFAGQQGVPTSLVVQTFLSRPGAPLNPPTSRRSEAQKESKEIKNPSQRLCKAVDYGSEHPQISHHWIVRHKHARLDDLTLPAPSEEEL